MTSRKRILFILHLPPPVHGASVVGGQIRDSRLVNETFEARYINLSASQRLEEIEKFSFRKVFSIFRIISKARKAVRSWKPDLVYVTPTSHRPGFFKDYLLVRMLKRNGCRLIAHYHNTGVRDYQERWPDKLLYARFFPQMQIILLSESLYPDIRKYVPGNRVQICPNGVAEMQLPVVEESPVPVILFLSNLLKSKGIFAFVQVCKALKEKGFAYRCDIAGGATADLDAAGLQAILAESGLEGMVTYHGPVYGDDKARLFAQADIFVFPSFLEAFPLVVAEAMSAGLPVVASRVGGVPDMVSDGETGFLVDPGDLSAFVGRTARLLVDRELRHSMGEAGLARYRERFSREQFEKRIVSILADA